MFQLSYVRTYHSKLTKIKQDMNSIEDRVARLQVRKFLSAVGALSFTFSLRIKAFSQYANNVRISE